MPPFTVIILGRTCSEWAGENADGEAQGRAGFNQFGSPQDLVANLESYKDLQLFDVEPLLSADRIVLCLVDSCQVSTARLYTRYIFATKSIIWIIVRCTARNWRMPCTGALHTAYFLRPATARFQ